MLDEKRILLWQRIIAKYSVRETIAAPFILMLINEILKLMNLTAFKIAGNWIFWFVGNEYIYIYKRNGSNVNDNIALHVYELFVIFLNITFVLRVLSTIIVLMLCRYKKIAPYYGVKAKQLLYDKTYYFPFKLPGLIIAAVFFTFSGLEIATNVTVHIPLAVQAALAEIMGSVRLARAAAMRLQAYAQGSTPRLRQVSMTLRPAA